MVAHRHAAGNFAMGTLLVKVSAAAKLGKAASPGFLLLTHCANIASAMCLKHVKTLFEGEQGR